MIQHVPFSPTLAAELAAREARDASDIAERRAASQMIVRQARPIVINKEVDVLTSFDGDDGRTWVKVKQRRDILL